MEPIYIGQEVPVELFVGEQVGTMQMMGVTLQNNEARFGVSNEGKCVRPAIFKDVVILNENFFAWQDDFGSRSISNKFGRDIALIPGYLHYVAEDFIVSHVVDNSNPNNVITTRVGVNVDGTTMSENELAARESVRKGYPISVDFQNGVYVHTANGIQVVNSEGIFNQEKSSGKTM